MTRPITEADIKLVAKLYQCRQAAKTLYGKKYAAKMDQYKHYIKAYMLLHNVEELPAAKAMIEDLKSDCGVTPVVILAAALELIEPE